jgi:outer membrane protein, protease secretion system
MKFKSRTLVLMWLALLAGAPTAYALTLQEAYDAALQYEPIYRAAAMENESGQFNRDIGKSALLPIVSLSYSNSGNTAQRTTPDLLGRDSTQAYQYQSVATTLSLKQPLLNYEGMAKYRQGLAQAEFSEATLKSRKQELAVRLMTAYTDVLFAQDQLALALAQVNTLQEQKNLNERSLQAGEGTVTDLLETQSKYDVAQTQVIETQAEVDNTRQVLGGMLGRVLPVFEAVAGIHDSFKPAPLMPPSLEDWKALALAGNADLQAQRHAVLAAQQDVAKNEAGHYPRVDLVASNVRSRADSVVTYNQSSDISSLGIQLNIPLYAGGYVQASTSQSLANLRRVEAELDGKTEKVLAELRKQFNLVRSSIHRVEALERAQDSAEKLILATRKSVQGGVRVNLDVLTAQQQLYTVRRDLAQARYTYFTAWVKLRFAAGVIEDEDMAQLARQFSDSPA